MLVPMSTPTTVNWTHELTEQLTFHWSALLRPKLDGLVDAEYFWEPVEPGTCWSVRRRGESSAPLLGGSGDWVMEFAIPAPDPPPVTTIAWRLGHLITGVIGARNHFHFGGPPCDPREWEYAGTAQEAIAQLEAAYERWIAAVSALDDEALATPVGPAEGQFAEFPMATLVLHIHREVIHHGAEILLLRDLYRTRVEG